MPHDATPDEACRENIDAALLQRLRELSACDFPGVDGMTAEDVLHCYPVLALRGRVPGRQELLRRYPEWTGRINALFSAPAHS